MRVVNSEQIRNVDMESGAVDYYSEATFSDRVLPNKGVRLKPGELTIRYNSYVSRYSEKMFAGR